LIVLSAPIKSAKKEEGRRKKEEGRRKPCTRFDGFNRWILRLEVGGSGEVRSELTVQFKSIKKPILDFFGFVAEYF
jgi:hypothetical protein